MRDAHCVDARLGDETVLGNVRRLGEETVRLWRAELFDGADDPTAWQNAARRSGAARVSACPAIPLR